MVIPYPPGGTSDFVGRVIALTFESCSGQTIVVDNKAGAASVIGTLSVAQAAPDGYDSSLAAPEFHAQSQPPDQTTV